MRMMLPQNSLFTSTQSELRATLSTIYEDVYIDVAAGGVDLESDCAYVLADRELHIFKVSMTQK